MRVLVASQEPGASRGLAEVVRVLLLDGHDVRILTRRWGADVFCRAGYAAFQNEIGEDNLNDEIRLAFDFIQPDVVLSGIAGEPGDSLDLEVQLIAKYLSIRSAALLDASLYYLDRIKGPLGEPYHYLPEKIFVMNEFTRNEMLLERFPSEGVVVTGQPSYDYLAFQPYPNMGSDILDVVFFSEGLAYEEKRRPEHSVGYDETVVIPLLIKVLLEVNLKQDIILTVKRHPKEDCNPKTLYISSKLMVKEVIDEDPVALMLNADLVCGMTSSLLVEAWLAGKPVVSLQPGLTSWNRLILCRAGILEPALTEGQALDFINESLKKKKHIQAPSDWCPNLGKAARCVVDELVKLKNQDPIT